MTCSGAPLPGVEVDLLIVPWCEDEGPEAVAGVDLALGGERRERWPARSSRRAHEALPHRRARWVVAVRRVLIIGARRAGFEAIRAQSQ